MAGRNGGRPKKEVSPDPECKLPKGLGLALAKSRHNADSESLLRDLVEIWGGTRQLAKDLYDEFQKASQGGQTRQRIMEMIQRLIISNTTHEIGKVVKPADLDDDELEQIALAYMRKVLDGPPIEREPTPATEGR